VDEVLLAERLIAYDTSRRSGIRLATDFVAGRLLMAARCAVVPPSLQWREPPTARLG